MCEYVCMCVYACLYVQRYSPRTEKNKLSQRKRWRKREDDDSRNKDNGGEGCCDEEQEEGEERFQENALEWPKRGKDRRKIRESRKKESEEQTKMKETKCVKVGSLISLGKFVR